jgi:hypothetical protein
MATKTPTNEELLQQIKELQAKQEASERRERLLNTNEARLGGFVTELKALPQEPKKDKEGKIIIGENGQPTLFDPFFSCSIQGMGVDETAYFGADIANNVKEGKAYLFEGYIKDRKFKVKNAIEI